jgi:FkbM family methyltransferase
MRSVIVRWLDRLAPGIGAAIRDIRDDRAARAVPPVQTPFGFLLGGSAEMVTTAFEPEETAFLQTAMAECDVFVDIGANVGFFSCLARARGKSVLAVEPLPRNVSTLCANLTANGWRDVEVFPLGLGDRPGIATLYGGGTGASLLATWSGGQQSRRREIPISTLDVILGGRFDGKRLLIKVDVEGVELDVLRGASAVLQRSARPVWLVEVCLTENFPAGNQNPHFREVFELFADSGYNAYSLSAGMRRVTLDDVRRWVERGIREFGYVSYVFTDRVLQPR